MSDPALTPEVLEKLVRLDREATRGPWEWDRSGVWQVDSAGPVLDLPYEGAPADGVGVVGDPYPRGGNNPTESMELIATMRNALPALLAAAQRVQAAQGTADRCHDCGGVYDYDTSIDREVWKRIAPKDGLLCWRCIDRRCAEAGIETEAKIYFSGNAIRSASYGEQWERQAKSQQAELDRLRAKVAELEESDRLYRAELAAIDAALGPVEDTRQAAVRGLEADSKRYQWLKGRYYGADFAYGNTPGEVSVLMFKMTPTMRVGGNLDNTIDDARQQEEKEG